MWEYKEVNIDSVFDEMTSSLLLRSWIFYMGWVIPTLYLNKVKIRLSSRLILSCLIQFWVDEPHVMIGWPGTKRSESIDPSMNSSNLYKIFLFSKSHSITLPIASEVAIIVSSSQKAIQIAGDFTFSLNTISSFLRLSITIYPFDKDNAIMFTSLEL